MGILNRIKKLTKGVSKQQTNKITVESMIAEYEQNENMKDVAKSLRETRDALVHSEIAINECAKADEQYNIDGDIEKRIAVYEKHFLVNPTWNSSNFNLALAKMYVKAGWNDKAWGYLNEMYLWAANPNSCIHGCEYRIRYEQFRILRTEKKYKDALILLIESNVISAYSVNGQPYFNKNKFIKDAKATAKKAGFSEELFFGLTDDLERRIITKSIQEKDVQQFCINYFNTIQ